MYIRNADIMPNWSDICNTADIPKLCDITTDIILREILTMEDDKAAWHRAVKEYYREMIESREEENRRRSKSVLQDYEEAISYFHYIQMIAFTEYAKIRSRQPSDGAISMLSFRASNDVLAAWNALLNGYYVTVGGILRGVYEAWISIIYFSEFPDKATIWWKMEPTKREEQGIRVSQMKGRLIEMGKLDREHPDIYSVFSQMTHPSADSMYPGLERGSSFDPRAIIFNVVGKFDEKKAKDFAKSVCIVSLNLTKIMFQVMKGAVERTPYKTLDGLSIALDALAQHLELNEGLLAKEPEKRFGVKHGLDEELFDDLMKNSH